MRPSRLYASIVFVLVLLFTAQFAWAQTDTARLQGTITDPDNAAVVGAAVTVTNTGTGQVSATTTNNLGYYTVSALPPGHYRVDVVQKSFKKVVRELDLQVSQIAVADFKLEVGAVTQSVTVEAGSPVIDPADSAIGQVVESRQVTQLPLNGRNFTQLATLAPGVTRGVPTGSATGASNNAETFRFGEEGGASLAVNGLRPQANNFILDGIDNNEALVNTIVFFPPADAIDEFRVQTSVAPAQFGRAGGALVVTSLKSGSNAFHGSAFWFNRNKALNAEDFFTSPGTPTPGFSRNQFGGTLGGPILKDKLFFFGDYEGLRQQIPGGPQYTTVPTDAMRTGDFSELLCGNPVPLAPTATCPISTGISTPIAILDPTTGLQFMGTGSQPNVIPTAQINTVGQAYLNAFPEPNCSYSQDTHCGSIINNYKNTMNQIENWNDFDIRIDYILNSKNTLFGRFSRGRADQTETTILSTLPSGFGSGTNFNHPWGTSIGLTSTLSSNMINEFRGGFVRTTYGYLPPQDNIDLCTQLGIVNCNTPLLGGIALIGGYGTQISYTGDYGPYLVPQTGFNYNDTLTWTRGRHTFKLGGSILRRQLNLYRPLAGKGYFFLSGNGNAGSHVSTNFETSDLLAGFVDSYSHGTDYGMVGTRTWENGFFAQDDFRATNRLTLNLGLRYDILTWPVEVENRQANFDLTTQALVVAGSNGSSRQQIPNDYHNFAPRLGFAYQLTGDGKTVLRGGYGLFYYIDRGGISNQLAQNPPFSGENTVTYSQGYRITLSGALPCEPTCTQSQLIATNATAPLPSGNFTNLDLSAPTGVSVIAMLPTDVTPQVSEWNLQLQRQVGSNQSVSIAYVGTHGAHLMRNYNANQQLFDSVPGTELNPNLGTITVQDTSGKSDYNSLQAQYERRFTSGFQFLGSFTWSKTIDDSCGNLDSCAPQLYSNYTIERGLSNQDQPYRLILSSLYELPFGRGKHFGGNISKPLDYVIGGWQLNGIYTLQAGLPFSITVDGNPGATRADLTGSPQVSPGNITQYMSASAFALPAGTIYYTGSGSVNGVVFNAPGTSGRDILIGPGSSNIDLSLFKNVSITERIKAEIRLQAYNLTNTPHFANPNSDLGGYSTACPSGMSTCPNDSVLVFNPNSQFGVINSVQPFSWRQVELGLRLTF
ncbi:MAG TPA: TonB-dependent receptor [Terriglobales bacterium]|nr:TonB-dependent receptor [Terriglobales bacterium]HUL14940.1 TonB-dependent receptor [Terriglobales bacterium]